MGDQILFADMDAVILCGGLGTRLRSSISDRPKALAPFGDVTFLDILVATLTQAGFSRIIFCTGYMKEQIKQHFSSRTDITACFSDESEPLGTGGALKNARHMIKSQTFIVLNGDSICTLSYPDFFRFHKEKQVTLSIALVRMNDTGDFGNVIVDESSLITRFREKVVITDFSLVSAGIYLLEQEIFGFFPNKAKFSLENQVFPTLAEARSAAGFIIDSELIDIGTPERYQMALHKIRGGL